MRKVFIIICLLISLTIVFIEKDKLASLFRPSTAYAVGDLTVNWGVPIGQPLFNISNSKPGDSFSKTVMVNDGATSGRPVGVRGIKISETGNLSNALTVTISQNGTDLYGGSTGEKTLAQFLQDSGGINGIFLSTLNPNSSASYVFTVQFKESAGNEFQGKTMVFDLHMGISFDVPTACLGIQFSGDPIFGTQGNDKMNGTLKNDMIVSLEGNDTVDGGQGNDCIVGGIGNDSLQGGNGDDVIVDMNGNNIIDGGNNDDKIITGNGNDMITGGNGTDSINAGDGADKVDAGNDVDMVFGEDGNDTLLLGNGNDTGNGGNGTDSINGGNGKDMCDSETKSFCE